MEVRISVEQIEPTSEVHIAQSSLIGCICPKEVELRRKQKPVAVLKHILHALTLVTHVQQTECGGRDSAWLLNLDDSTSASFPLFFPLPPLPLPPTPSLSLPLPSSFPPFPLLLSLSPFLSPSFLSTPQHSLFICALGALSHLVRSPTILKPPCQ